MKPWMWIALGGAALYLATRATAAPSIPALLNNETVPVVPSWQDILSQPVTYKGYRGWRR